MNVEEITVSEPAQKKGIKLKIKNAFSSIKNGIINFAELSWKGAAVGAVLAMIIHLFLIGSFFSTGISPVLDWLLILILSSVIILGTAFTAKPLFSIISKFNPWFVAAVFATFIISGFMPLKVFGQNLILLELICGALAGYALSRGTKKPLSVFLIILVIIINILIIINLRSAGSDNTIEVSNNFWNQNQLVNKPVKSIEAPVVVSEIKTLFYGSGTDKHRNEYNKNVNIKTKSVDAVPFFDQTSGFSNKMREWYWGFNSKNYPLNARVWYAEHNTPLPLVLIVHGNHNMLDYSDSGYEYLGNYLAQRGYIVASIDENFLNGGWMGDYNQSEIFTRAWLLLKHLELWREWNSSGDNIFHNKVDLNNIALIGHSRGGAAVALASALNKMKRYHQNAVEEFNFGFNIKSIIQIAPNDPYNPQTDVPLTIENIDYLVLQGGFDQDMSWFMGNRFYNRLKFTDGKYHFKSALYIYKANHGQFNSVWGRTDHNLPLSWFFNTKPILSEEDQQKIAERFISGFLHGSLKQNMSFLPVMKDFRYGRDFLPRDYYINQFEDSDFRYIADYQEDLDVTTASLAGCIIDGKNFKVWSENALSSRDDWNSSQHNSGVFIGWDKNVTTQKGTAEYIITLDNSFADEPTTINNIFFFICNNKEDIDTLDFTIELSAGPETVSIPFSFLRILPPQLKTSLTKWPFIYSVAGDNKAERVLQFTEIPVSEIIIRNKNFSIKDLISIKFIFDKTEKGEIILDKIGYN